MSVSELKDIYNTNPEYFYIAIGVFVALCGLLWVIIKFINKDAENKKIKKVLKSIGTDFVQNVAIPDGLEGFVFFDYMVLTPTGILVVDVQNYNGYLFGGETVDDWTQMIGRKSYKFKNPLPRNEHHVQSVKEHTGDVPVQGRIVFTSMGKFPKGIPKGVSTTGSLKDDVSFSVVGNAIPEIFQKTWNELLAIVNEANQKVSLQRK